MSKQRLTEFNQSNILTAAKELFREKGVAQTTMDDIAEKADYSKSTLYVYFKSKDEIYNHIIYEHFQILRNVIAETLSGAPGFPEGYYGICHALAKSYETNPLYFESIIGKVELPREEADSVLAQIYQVGEEINRIIEEYIRTWCLKQKIILAIPPLQASFTFFAGISGIIMLANKKETYICQSMGISKEKFMRDGFDLLLKSITTESHLREGGSFK